jgi:hypothetical protein
MSELMALLVVNFAYKGLNEGSLKFIRFLFVDPFPKEFAGWKLGKERVINGVTK